MGFVGCLGAGLLMGVMLGSAPTAARTATSEVFGRRSASSTPISKRIASNDTHGISNCCGPSKTLILKFQMSRPR